MNYDRHNVDDDPETQSPESSEYDSTDNADLSSAAEEFLMENQADADSGDFDLQEPELQRDEYVNGKLVRRSPIKKALTVLLLILTVTGVVFFVFNCSLDRKSVDNWLYRHHKAPSVTVSSLQLDRFTAGLQPGQIIPGLDIELFDNGQRVQPANYTVSGKSAPLRLTICIDGHLSGTALKKILTRLSNIQPGGNNSRYERIYSVYQAAGSRSGFHCLLNEQNTFLPVNKILQRYRPFKSDGKFLIKVMHSLTQTTAKPRQIVFIAEDSLAKRKSFNSEELYNFLKKHRNYQLYNIKTKKDPILPSRDPFIYLHNNPADFGKLKHDFNSWSILSNGWYTSLESDLSAAVPLERIFIEYKPNKDSLEIDSQKLHSFRNLTVMIRKNQTDHKLTQLPSVHYWPRRYRYSFPDSYKYPPHEKPHVINNTHLSTNRILALFDPDDADIEKNIHIVSAKLRSYPEAVLTNGIVIFSNTHTLTFKKLSAVLKDQAGPAIFTVFEPLFIRQINLKQKNTTATGSRLDIDKVNAALITGFAGELPHWPAAETKNSGAVVPQKLPSIIQRRITGDHKKNIPEFNLVINHYGAATLTAAGDTTNCLAGGFETISLAIEAINWSSQNNMPLLSAIDHNGVTGEGWHLNKRSFKFWKDLMLESKKAGVVWIYPAELKNNTKNVININSFAIVPGDSTGVPPDRWQAALSTTGFAFPVQAVDGFSAVKNFIPVIGFTVSALSNGSFPEYVEAVQHGSTGRGRLSGIQGYNTVGYTKQSKLKSVIDLRNRLHSTLITFAQLEKNAYSDVDATLFGDFNKKIDKIAAMKSVPPTKDNIWYKTYQFFDREMLYTGRKSSDALYNLHTRFNITKAERPELAVVSFRGSFFLFCTRNRHRGWICNLQSPPAGNGTDSLHYDINDNLIFFYTARGELVALDLQRGLIQQWRDLDNTINSRPALITDHGANNGKVIVDSRYNNIWIYGAGSNRLVRIKYRRKDNTVLFRQLSDDTRKFTLFKKGSIAATMPVDRLFSNAVLFNNGTLNLVRNRLSSKQPAAYFRFDKNGVQLKH